MKSCLNFSSGLFVIAKVMTLSAHQCQMKNTETEFRGHRKMALFLCPVRGEYSRLAPQEVFQARPSFFSILLTVPFTFLFFSSVQLSCSVVSDSLQPHEPQHARPPCPSPSPGVHSNSHPSSG